MVSYTLAHEAYLKIIFHAAKHPHLPVNGVLVGKLSLSNSVIIEDAIPLLHHWTSLSPMMEISLDLVSEIFAVTGRQPDRSMIWIVTNICRVRWYDTGRVLPGL